MYVINTKFEGLKIIQQKKTPRFQRKFKGNFQKKNYKMGQFDF